MEKIPYLGQTLTRWRVGDSTFVALPERGARLMYWNITMGDGSVRDVSSGPNWSRSRPSTRREAEPDPVSVLRAVVRQG